MCSWENEGHNFKQTCTEYFFVQNTDVMTSDFSWVRNGVISVSAGVIPSQHGF